MPEIVGYKLIKDADGSVIERWGGTWGQCPGIPNPIILPNGDHVSAPTINASYSGYTLKPWEMQDPRFYNADNTQKTLADCVQAQINVVNAHVANVLQPSDWMVTRAAEGYKPAPANVVTYRKAVRDQGNALVAEVKALTDVNAVIAWQPHDWPTQD